MIKFVIISTKKMSLNIQTKKNNFENFNDWIITFLIKWLKKKIIHNLVINNVTYP